MAEKQQALEAIDRERGALEALSDAIWDHPEVGYRETFAADALCAFLEQNGFQVERGLAGIPTAFCGSYGSGSPVIGLLGEFDALPGMSQKADCFTEDAAEAGGAGHGCGHNLLGVGAVAAALAVKAYLEAGRPGTVKFFGCPAEEGGSGKGFMARAGVFQGVDAAFSWHPGEVNSVSTESTMANYQIRYRFHGVSSHAAMAPELGRSALDALELMNVGVQFLREHIPGDTRIHYAITDTGGSAPGTVQSHAEAMYLLRAVHLPQVKELYDRVNKIAQGAANIIVPIFGGIPVTGAIARTMTNINNGGRSPIAGIIHAIVLLLILLFLGPLTRHIPMACLAGVLIIVSYNMSEWRTFRSLMKNPKSDVSVLLVTFLLTVIFDLTIAIEIGLLIAMLLFMRRVAETTRVSVATDVINLTEENETHQQQEEKLAIPRGVEVYEIDGPFFFGIANKFDSVMKSMGDKPHVRVIRMRKVPFMDSTGLHNLESLIRLSKAEGIQVVLSGVNERVRHVLERSNVDRMIGPENICANIHQALERASRIL